MAKALFITRNDLVVFTSANGNLEEAISYIERDAQRNFRLVKKHLKIFPILSLGIKYNM